MGRWAAGVLAIALLAAACGGAPAAPAPEASTAASTAVTTTAQDPYAQLDCESAPVGQRDSASSVPLALIPYPVTAGASVRVEIGATEENPTMVGWGVDWQCWNGSSWVGTHQLGFGLEAGGDVVPVVPGATTTVPAIGYMVPMRGDFFVTVPDVPPGWYRLHVPPLGYLAVEVVAGG
jgi:hypothetical protein